MTTSPIPWSLTTYPSGDKAICGAVVRDASGQQIGFFTDYRNAERVLEVVRELEEARADIEKLEIKIEELGG